MIVGKEFLSRITKRLHTLYGPDSIRLINRVLMILERYGVYEAHSRLNMSWTEQDAFLITYGDSIEKDHSYSLDILDEFLDTYVQDSISTVHILPFFYYSSDDGFSVIDFRSVREDLGGWYHIRKLSKKYKVMGDLVINHASSQSEWFNDFVKHTAPACDYFITVDPNTDLSQVVRPRDLPLLTEVPTDIGNQHVWTTFSEDQIDLNFKNPDVLFEFIDILLWYISQGISVIRLDAIAYLWKEMGTSCIHLEQTHEVIKLFRDILEVVAPDTTLITETNVPHKENVSYFGDGDEAHMVYQFSLPPLILYTMVFGDASQLINWAKHLEPPKDGCYFFNFTASHDGFGLRPLEGIVDPEHTQALIDRVVERGGKVSMKANANGIPSPYELNATWYSALDASDGLNVERYLCSKFIMLSFQGIPAIYIQAILGIPNDIKGFQNKGYNRALNRKQFKPEEIHALLEDGNSHSHQIFFGIKHLLKKRATSKAFHPNAPQEVIEIDPRIFALKRSSFDGEVELLCIANVSAKEVSVDVKRIDLQPKTSYMDLITHADIEVEEQLKLNPYEYLWLVLNNVSEDIPEESLSFEQTVGNP